MAPVSSSTMRTTSFSRTSCSNQRSGAGARLLAPGLAAAWRWTATCWHRRLVGAVPGFRTALCDRLLSAAGWQLQEPQLHSKASSSLPWLQAARSQAHLPGGSVDGALDLAQAGAAHHIGHGQLQADIEEGALQEEDAPHLGPAQALAQRQQAALDRRQHCLRTASRIGVAVREAS